MLSNLTWQGYWMTVALCSAAYYLWIYLKYFNAGLFGLAAEKSDLQTISFGGNGGPSPVEDASPIPSVDEAEPLVEHVSQNDIEYAAYSLMDELNAYLQEAKRTKCVREELVFALQVIFNKYPRVSTSSFSETVSKFLVAECRQVCSVHLSEEEVRRVWKGG